jgi:hypothetical protein
VPGASGALDADRGRRSANHARLVSIGRDGAVVITGGATVAVPGVERVAADATALSRTDLPQDRHAVAGPLCHLHPERVQSLVAEGGSERGTDKVGCSRGLRLLGGALPRLPGAPRRPGHPGRWRCAGRGGPVHGGSARVCPRRGCLARPTTGTHTFRSDPRNHAFQDLTPGESTIADYLTAIVRELADRLPDYVDVEHTSMSLEVVSGTAVRWGWTETSSPRWRHPSAVLRIGGHGRGRSGPRRCGCGCPVEPLGGCSTRSVAEFCRSW